MSLFRTGNVDGIMSVLPGEAPEGRTIVATYLLDTVVYNTVTALANTSLSVNVETGGVYAVDLMVLSVSTTKALNMDFGGTSTIQKCAGLWYGAAQADPLTGADSAFVDNPGTDFTVAGLDGIDAIFTFKGVITVTAAGTFLLRAAQNASHASDTSLLEDSYMILTKLN